MVELFLGAYLVYFRRCIEIYIVVIFRWDWLWVFELLLEATTKGVLI